MKRKGLFILLIFLVLALIGTLVASGAIGAGVIVGGSEPKYNFECSITVKQDNFKTTSSVESVECSQGKKCGLNFAFADYFSAKGDVKLYDTKTARVIASKNFETEVTSRTDKLTLSGCAYSKNDLVVKLYDTDRNLMDSYEVE